MGTPRTWRKSSYSGPGDGNSCLEIAHTRALVAIRDSKAPMNGTLAFPTEAFGAFVRAIKETAGRL